MKQIIGLLLIFCFITPSLTWARDFDPNFIISDIEATETASFTVEGLQAFLGAQNSYLAGYNAPDIDGITRKASEIIHSAAIRNKVSPRFLLALLQREQSLMTDKSPSQKQLDWAMGFGICDACSMDDPTLQKYRGFANQIDYAAANFRYFMDNSAVLSGFRKKDQPAVIDGITVIPVNAATANLYNYTPHLNAQINFWLVWQEYFLRRYPSGTLAASSPAIPGIWLIRFGERRKITSPAVLASRYDPNKVINIAANDLLAYPEGAPIKFPNYSLLRSPGGTVYLIVDDERRGIASREVFRNLGFNPDEVEDVSWEDLNIYSEGAPITMTSSYPFGALLQDPTSGGVYFVQNGIKHPLYAKELLSLYFKSRKIKQSTLAELNSIQLGEPITLADGELVRTADNPAVYVIADGKRLPINSADTFEKQGWKWENVAIVSEKVLALSPLGESI